MDLVWYKNTTNAAEMHVFNFLIFYWHLKVCSFCKNVTRIPKYNKVSYGSFAPPKGGALSRAELIAAISTAAVSALLLLTAAVAWTIEVIFQGFKLEPRSLSSCPDSADLVKATVVKKNVKKCKNKHVSVLTRRIQENVWNPNYYTVTCKKRKIYYT